VTTNDGLLLQEETSTEFASLFANADTQAPDEGDSARKLTIVHLGFDRSNETSDDWYLQPDHPYRQAIVRVLKHLKQWEHVTSFKFCVSSNDSDLPADFVETVNLGLSWHNPWLGDRMYEWFNFFLHDGDDLAILNK
jgi:3,4-dihydroxy 2-butanone 4-phosphate synthase/GTP cyclohydrolase II